jgi:riboflavin transporter FmnP
MWIDLVAVSWLIGYFIFGGRTAFVVSVVGALMITLMAPSTWLGAFMKWLATVPMFLVPMAYQKLRGAKLENLSGLRLLIPLMLVAILIRGAIIIPVNYYFAIPIWMQWTLQESMTYVPWWAIFGINAIQGAIEVLLAWLLVFRFRLDRFRTW